LIVRIVGTFFREENIPYHTQQTKEKTSPVPQEDLILIGHCRAMGVATVRLQQMLAAGL